MYVRKFERPHYNNHKRRHVTSIAYAIRQQSGTVFSRCSTPGTERRPFVWSDATPGVAGRAGRPRRRCRRCGRPLSDAGAARGSSILHGAVFALWPVMWLVFNGLLLYNIVVRSGRFDALRSWMLDNLPNDRRVVLVVGGFCVGALRCGVGAHVRPQHCADAGARRSGSPAAISDSGNNSDFTRGAVR
jgi:L-lactate permease